MTLAKLKKQRGPIRAGVTRSIAAVDVEIVKTPPCLTKLKAELEVLEDLHATLMDLDEKILEIMLDEDAPDAEWDAENEAIQGYKAKFISARVNANELIHTPVAVPDPRPPSPQPSEAGSSSGQRRQYKLPKIKLKKFSGELTEWISWWAQFEKIDEDEELHETDKFQYLSQSMVPGSRAFALVERYPQSKENYPKVVSALKERYGKPKLLIQVYVRELIHMIMCKPQQSEKSALATLHDKLESHLRSLESLGVTLEQMVMFLFPMVESCIPKETFIAWQRSPLYEKDGSLETPPKSELDYLLQFLKQEIDREEQRNLADAGFGLHGEKRKTEKRSGVLVGSSRPQRNRHSRLFNDEDVPTAAGLFNGERKSTCIFCDGGHPSADCKKALNMDIGVKRDKVMSRKVCFICLRPGHMSKSCKASVSCTQCGRRHHLLFCPDHPSNKKSTPAVDQSVETAHANLSCSSEVVLQTLTVEVRNQDTGKSRLVRVLIDSGSQRSYISKKVVEDLGIKPSCSILLNHMLFGGNEVSATSHGLYEVLVCAIRGYFSTSMKVVDQETICGTIPRVEKGAWMAELRKRKIFISDLSPLNPTEVELLIGSDNLGALLTGNIAQLDNGLTATETRFGWTLMGSLRKSGTSSLAMNVISTTLSCTNISDLWSLETLGIRDPVEVLTKEEKNLAVSQHFKETVKRETDGRYSVCLPWIDNNKNIPSNRAVAAKRLQVSTSKLISQGKFDEYDEIFRAWEREGIISQCEEDAPAGCHYLPHRAVFKPESKTTPVRPVFDASCKVGRAPSLNDCLEKGPNLLELIPDILLRFRLGRIGVIADIRKAFLMVQVDNGDRNFVRFLWWENYGEKKLKVYRHNRVVFGVNSSPFLLGAVIAHHLDQYGGYQREYAQTLAKSLYVDNAVTSVNNMNELKKFKEISTQLMADAKMELREWEYTRDNSPQQVTSVLGLKWEKTSDMLFCEGLGDTLPERVTKRVILSEVQKVFDPLGFLCPTLLVPKMMLQKTWAEKKGWDESVSKVTRSDFVQWFEEMNFALGKIRIPRMATAGEGLGRNSQLHLFTDASKLAYAAAVFLRVVNGNSTSVQLLAAKSRVAPVKQSTIPRLELLGCTIGARLLTTVQQALNNSSIETTCWSDSTTALAWIRRNDDWGTFVGNRVKEICSLTTPSQWRHVPGTMNPADLPSRGCNPRKLLESRWWEGPDWLRLEPSKWPNAEPPAQEDLVLQEKKKSAIMAMLAIDSRHEAGILSYTKKYSSFNMNCRVLAMVLRFINKVKGKKCESGKQPSQSEVGNAELVMFRLIQEETLPKDQKVICGLRVMTDKAGVIRVVTKLTNRQDSNGFRYPALLPASSALVDQLIREEHIFHGHAGTQFLMSNLRERCWIICGRKAIKSVVRSCVICRRFDTQSPKVLPAALPEDRVKDATAFEVTGVDLAGPLVLKNKSKVWIVLFTCAVYRCVHLELVQTLCTEDFLLALIRFCKRKRRPSTIYSDNGTNFVGTFNLFSYIDWKAVEERTRDKRIQWKFNPPSAPWWGGWWERLIRSTKGLLKKMLGFGKLSYVQLETCLCEVEYTINHRPLTYVTEDQDDLIPLTPAMFIHDLPVSGCPEAKLLKVQGLQSRVKDLRQLGDELRRRFRQEYLSQLVQRGKDRRYEAVNVGDVVLVGSDNKKRVEWPMARIVELMPGRDGHVRVARVKTSSGTIIRPVQRLYPLEVSSHTESIPIPNSVKELGKKEKARAAAVNTEDDSPHSRPGPRTKLTPAVDHSWPIKTRSGRKVIKPNRFSQ